MITKISVFSRNMTIEINEPYSCCGLFKNISSYFWDRIKFNAHRKGISKLHEVTITEDIVYEVLQFKEIHKYLEKKEVLISEAINESANGNDLEVYLQLNGKDEYIFIPIQAKLIKYEKPKFKDLKNGEYSEITHPKKKNTKQIELLTEYASKRRGLPMYLFYNYVNDGNFNPLYGCTLIDAYYIKEKYFNDNTKKWKSIPTFKDLHDQNNTITADTWDSLVCEIFNNKQDFINLFKKTEKSIDLKLYEYLEIRSQPNWKDIDLAENISDDTINKNDLQLLSNDSFNPKYRLVISNQKNENKN